MSKYELVHLNVVRPLGPFSIDTEELQYFIGKLNPIMTLADETEGLLWHDHAARLADGRYIGLDELFALTTDGENNPTIMTMAGWADAHALHRFARRTPDHSDGIKSLRHWVDRSEGPTLVLWWERSGERPSFEKAWSKLKSLRESGPTPEAFSLQARFDPGDR